MRTLAQIQGVQVPDSFKNFKLGGDPSQGYSAFFARDLPSTLTSRILTFAILGAGIYFFIRLISAGYQFLTSAGDSNKIQSATKEITNSAIGFIVIISSYFLAQLLEILFGIRII